MRFTLKQLEVFYTAAQELNLRRTAERCFISTPAVSKNIRNLEAACGSSLFGLNGKRLYLTDAGMKLFRSLKPFRKQLDILESTIDGLNAKNDEPIRLCVTNTFQPLVLPWLKLFIDRHPDIQFNLTIQTWVVQLHMLDEKKPSIYLMGESKMNEEEYHTEIIRQFSLILVAHSSHPLAGQKVSAEQLRHEQFLLPYAQSDSSRFQEKITTDWGVAAPRIYLDSYGAILSATRAGMGLALLPDAIVQNSLKSGKLVKLEVDLPDNAYDLQFCYPKNFAPNENELLIQKFLRQKLENI